MTHEHEHEHDHKHGFNFEFDENATLNERIKIVVENQIIKPYVEKAVKEAETHIYFTEAEERLLPIEADMCMRILSTWKLDLYDIDIEEVVNSYLLAPKDKFFRNLLYTPILRLLPAGVTILSVGISQNLAMILTSAIGYGVSELSCTYFNMLRDGKKVDAKDIYTLNALSQKMDDYLVEYNKTLVKF